MAHSLLEVAHNIKSELPPSAEVAMISFSNSLFMRHDLMVEVGRLEGLIERARAEGTASGDAAAGARVESLLALQDRALALLNKLPADGVPYNPIPTDLPTSIAA